MKPMKRGGRRPGAGRRKNVEIARVRALAAQAVSDEDWIAILKGLADEAQYGNVRCAELLMSYAFGITSSNIAKHVARQTTR
jgi:hypothetical protein